MSELLQQALERIRFERLMGVECVTRVARTASLSEALTANVVTHAPLTGTRPPLTRSSVPPRGEVDRSHASGVIIAKEGSVEERWQRVEAQALACTICPLHRTRTKVVFGSGNRAAKLMFIGEGPGDEEDSTGEPFVGRAGLLLNKIIGAMGFKREDVYLTNVVKCHPPGNRSPLPDETSACAPYLFEQIDLVKPQVLIALGGLAAKLLLNTVSGIGAIRGRWNVFRGIPVMPTFHPAFVLRTYTEEVRGQVWSDMKQVMEKLKATP